MCLTRMLFFPEVCRPESGAGILFTFVASLKFSSSFQLCAGPLPLFNDPGHKGMIDHLQSLAASLPEPPKALVSN